MTYIKYNIRPCSTALIGLTALLWCSSALAQTHPVADARGLNDNRDYFSQVPFEHIDTLSGGLVLTFTDLVLQGNAGRELRFQRTYNSKFNSRGQWTFGIAGVVLDIIDPPLPPVKPLVEPIPSPWFLTADGAEQPTTWLHRPFTDTEALIQSTLRWVSSGRFGRYDRTTRTLYQPDGTVCQYEAPSEVDRRVRTCTDPFNNVLEFLWHTDALEVIQHFGSVSRSVILTWKPGTRMVASLAFEGREWTYHYTPPDAFGRILLERAVPPTGGPAWRYAYQDQELVSLTTPHGGIIEYAYETKDFVRLWTLEGDPPTTTHVFTRVIARRETKGRSVVPGVWTYSYVEGVGQDTVILFQPAQPPSEAVQSPRTRTSYQHAAVVSDPVFPGADWAVTGRIVEEERGAAFVELERESRHYQVLPVTQNPPPGPEPPFIVVGMPAVRERVVTRDGGSYTTRYEYTATNNADLHQPSVITEIGPDQRTRITRRTYKSHWLSPYIAGLPKTEAMEADGDTFSTSREYADSTGFLLSATRFGVTTTFVPDASGNLGTRRTATGKATTFEYAWGVPSRIVTPEHTVTRIVGPDGTIQAESRNGRTTSFSYDGLFRLTSVQPSGNTNAIVTEYDNLAGTTVTTRRGPSGLITSLDGFGRITGTINNVNVRTFRAYDADGRLTFESYPFEGSQELGTRFEHDALGRVTRRTNPDGTTATYTYGLGRVTVRDEKGRETVQTVEAFGDPNDTRLTALRDAATQTWVYEYTGMGDLRRVTAPDGVVRSFQHIPGTDRVQSETHPESGTTRYEYDAAGNLASKTDAKGQVTTYAYDANDRLTTIAAGDHTTTIEYEPGSDNRQSVTVGDVSTTFTYEATTGRLQSRRTFVDGRSYKVSLEYDGNDNVVTIEYPSGRRLGYAHDDEGRVRSVFDRTAVGRTYASEMTYHPSGALTSYLAGNGIRHTFTFDERRYWPRTILSGELSLAYENYDEVGNVHRIVDGRSDRTQTFTYDQLDRLTTAQGHYGSILYAYDAHGNRTTANGTIYEYLPGTLRLGRQGDRTFTYDPNGNLESETQPTRQFTYTPHNMLATVTGVGASSYAYDGDNWRVKKQAGDGTTIYVRGVNNELLSEWQNPGASEAIRDYVYAGPRMLAVIAR